MKEYSDFSLNLVACEGLLEKEKLIEHDSKAPDIESIVLLFLIDDLRAPVQSSSNCSLTADTFSIAVAASEVDYFDDSSIEHNVLKLDISVNNVIDVQFLEALAELVGYFSDSFIRKTVICLQRLIVKVELALILGLLLVRIRLLNRQLHCLKSDPLA